MNDKYTSPCNGCDIEETCTKSTGCDRWRAWFGQAWERVTAPFRVILGRDPKTGKKEGDGDGT